jgi:hypothetical protein
MGHFSKLLTPSGRTDNRSSFVILLEMAWPGVCWHGCDWHETGQPWRRITQMKLDVSIGRQGDGQGLRS